MKRFTAVEIKDGANTVISPWVYVNPNSVSWVAPHWSKVKEYHSNSTIYFTSGTCVHVVGDTEEVTEKLGWQPTVEPSLSKPDGNQ
jgi:hypothetical protein